MNPLFRLRELGEVEVRRERKKAEEERDRLMEQLREVNGRLVQTSLRAQEQATEMDTFVTAIEVALAHYKASRKSQE